MGKKGIILCAVFFLASCSGLQNKKDFMVSPALSASKGSLAAVLPFDNASTDLNAETILRDMVAKGLERKGWMVMKNEAVDEKLNELGVSDGGQLPAFKVQDIVARTGARILCYGYIEDFKFQNLGFIVRKNVELELKIVDGLSGEVLFEGAGKGSDTKFYTDKEEAKKAFIVQTGVKLINNMTNKPLIEESQKAIDRIFMKLP